MAAEYLQRMGERMAERRKDLGLTQEQVARALPGETSGTHVSRWERGLHRPSDDTLEALAKVLDVDVSYFLAAQPTKSDGTPDPFAASDQLDRLEKKIDDIARRERTASEEREVLRQILSEITNLLKRQDEILAELQRVAGGMPDDETLQRLDEGARLVNEGAQQLLDAAQAAQADHDEQSAAQAGSRRRQAGS